jgi:hypothetical protein
MMFKWFGVFVMLALLAIIVSMIRSPIEKFNALDHPNKCYSCETQFPVDYAWMGQKTKCLSCERDAFLRSGGNPVAVFNEHPIKYYSLDGMPPMPAAGYHKIGYLRV